MTQSIAHHKIRRPEHHIVTHYLVEDVLREPYLRRLVFHYHQGVRKAVEHHRVASSFPPVLSQAYLVGHGSGIKPFAVDKILHKMLSYPFFGGQYHEFFPESIPHHRRPVGSPAGESQIGSGQIQIHAT